MLGRFLFRWRGVIGLAAFVVVFWLARPTVGSCFAGLAFVLAGLATRFWASGYIGIEGRAREIGASRRIVSGPYRLLRHPLYIGNALLVVGMLVAMRPGVAASVAVLLLFVLEYSLIVISEEKELSTKWKVERGNGKGAGEEAVLRGVESRESFGRSQNAECRRQKTEIRMANGERRMARGEQFGVRRALCEWRTWVVTGVAFGLEVAKAAVRS